MAMSTVKLAVMASAVAVVCTAVGVGAGVALADQPHMQSARDDLNTAQNQLQIARPDKDGHRANAIHLVQEAINETNLGIQAGGG